MKKRIICYILISIFTMGCFAGCSNANGKAEPAANHVPTQGQTPGLAQVPEAEPAEIDVYTEAAPIAYDDAFLYAGGAAQEVEPQIIDWNTEEYDFQKENSFQSVKANPFATFAADVDTASYANFRRQVLQGQEVVPDSVRVEEFINYFRYNYPEPENGEPFAVTTELAPCPWNEKTQLLSVGLQAKNLDTSEMPRSNLVFLIDVSGSMDEYNKLPLVQRSFMTLVENLNEDDVVSIVTYAAGETIVCDGVSGADKQQLVAGLEGLTAYGCTQGDKAIQMAYDLAEQHYIEGGVNRVIMATDGDFNVGITSEGELTRLIQENAKKGVFLSVLGYGMGNYKDNKLESMADNGNGNYAYIDTIDEARKVLVSEAGGTLFTVAKDVKLQVEFNPAVVKGYRLIGYENRVMNAEDFADDTKDGGEIGAGHQVTALFEIVPVESAFEIPEVDSKYGTPESVNAAFTDEVCTVNIRYKAPEASESSALAYPVKIDGMHDEMSENMMWAAGVAEVAMLLKNSEYKGTSSYETVKEMLKPIANDGFREEFVYLIGKLH